MREIYLKLLEHHPDNAELKVVFAMTKTQHEWNYIEPQLLERFIVQIAFKNATQGTDRSDLWETYAKAYQQ